MADALLPALLVTLAVLQTTWFIVYGSGPWRATHLGWVWLLKGGLLALLWWLLLIDNLVDVHPWIWAGLGIGLVIGTGAWLAATLRVRFGD